MAGSEKNGQTNKTEPLMTLSIPGHASSFSICYFGSQSAVETVYGLKIHYLKFKNRVLTLFFFIVFCYEIYDLSQIFIPGELLQINLAHKNTLLQN
jgi:hypothetical protein